MIVSWEWLREYVSLDVPLEDFLGRLTMAGLNIDSKKSVGDDWAVDVEVTSNRPDCLGHIGVAREAGVLFGRPLKVPDPNPKSSGGKTAEVPSVVVECPELCPQYFARVIRGVKIGPSPAWLRKRLETIGIASINNVVDMTNYVLMECGQPLHAFDFDRLHGRRIIVRPARPGEKLVAINQRTYDLQPGMCVIADADRPVAIGGVMGGLETEIGPTAKNMLIEAAEFHAPVDPQHGPETGPAQRFVVSLRARHRSGAARLGQPPLLRVDPRAGRRRAFGDGGLRRSSSRTRAPANHAAVRTHPQDPGDRRAAGRSGPHPCVAGD